MKLAILVIIIATPFFAAAQTTKKTPPQIPAPAPIQESECIKLDVKPMFHPYDTTDVRARQMSLAKSKKQPAVKQ